MGSLSYGRIYEVVSRIARGRVATYGQVALVAGLPGRARQVGYALAALDDGSRVPWHRVVNAKGQISPRRGGSDLGMVQRLRLEREGVKFDERGTIPLARFRWLPRGARAAGRAILALGLLLQASGLLAAESHAVRCGGAEYTYLLSTPGKSEPMPAILLLHGAGGHPEHMTGAWEAFAASNGIVLVAPEIPRKSTFEPIAPGVFRCIVEDAKTRTKIDPRRVYVFGHSMGGYLTFDTAMFESEYFAAAAVHAGAIAPDYASIVGFARRKMPILIVSGDKDPMITIESVRWTRDLLVGKGFSVQLIELKDHDHRYESWADRVNPEVWKFLSQQTLPPP